MKVESAVGTFIPQLFQKKRGVHPYGWANISTTCTGISWISFSAKLSKFLRSAIRPAFTKLTAILWPRDRPPKTDPILFRYSSFLIGISKLMSSDASGMKSLFMLLSGASVVHSTQTWWWRPFVVSALAPLFIMPFSCEYTSWCVVVSVLVLTVALFMCDGVVGPWSGLDDVLVDLPWNSLMMLSMPRSLRSACCWREEVLFVEKWWWWWWCDRWVFCTYEAPEVNGVERLDSCCHRVKDISWTAWWWDTELWVSWMKGWLVCVAYPQQITRFWDVVEVNASISSIKVSCRCSWDIIGSNTLISSRREGIVPALLSLYQQQRKNVEGILSLASVPSSITTAQWIVGTIASISGIILKSIQMKFSEWIQAVHEWLLLLIGAYCYMHVCRYICIEYEFIQHLLSMHRCQVWKNQHGRKRENSPFSL